MCVSTAVFKKTRYYRNIIAANVRLPFHGKLFELKHIEIPI